MAKHKQNTGKYRATLKQRFSNNCKAKPTQKARPNQSKGPAQTRAKVPATSMWRRRWAIQARAASGGAGGNTIGCDDDENESDRRTARQ